MQYSPFETFNFGNKTCFLSGETLPSTDQKIEVFPLWLQNRFELTDQPFKLLNEQFTTYGKLKLPCSKGVKETIIDPFEKKIETAFTSGYDAVKQLSEEEIFYWFGKIMYGIIFNEIQVALLEKPANEPLNMNAGLIDKFTNHHLLLQSMRLPMLFEDFTPWSVFVFEVEQGADLFDYRDEMNTLIFSLQMNGFGILICMQDNGENKRYHHELIEKIRGKKLHPAQFQEFCAKLYYSAYLFNRIPRYITLPPTKPNEPYTISSMPLHGSQTKALFDPWQNKVYAQVLEAFWKRWGFVKFEIIKNPEHPMSLLLNENGEFNHFVELPV